MNNLHVKTGDNVMIISGKDKGHTGKVLQVSPAEGKVIVEGQNMVTKHVKHQAPCQGYRRHLPQVRQGRACGPRRKGRQDGSRLQEVRR